jgi:Protein of unknown function (DUF1236)
MRTMLLMSVAAAALIAGSGFASAQGPSQSREGSSPPPAAQPSAPAEKIAPMKGAAETKAPDSGLKAGQAEPRMAPSKGQTEPKAAPGIKAGQAEQMEPKRPNPQQAQDKAKDGMKPKSVGSETQSQVKPDGKTNLDGKADGKPTPDVKADTKSSEKVGDANTSSTAQGAAAGAANLSTEQRTTIRTVIRQQNVQPATNVNFSISVGSRVSDNVHFYPLPAELVQIQPHWRGYQFFLVGNQIIVVNPQTHQIVAVLDA